MTPEQNTSVPQWRKGWPPVDGFYWSRETPDDMNILLVEIHRNRLTICGGNKRNVKEAFEGDNDEFLGPITPTSTTDAATSMRSVCIEKVKDYRLKCEQTGVDLAEKEDESSQRMYWRADGAADALEIVERELESVSIQEQETKADEKANKG